MGYVLLYCVAIGAIIGLVIWLFGRFAGGSRGARPRAGQPPLLPKPPAYRGAPGWYAQPDGTQRYWDGNNWTDRAAP